MNRGGYFAYLEDIVGRRLPMGSLLLPYLFDRPFTWSFKIPTDANRAKDGLMLRDRYANETGDYLLYSDKAEPCSILEMLVALSIRIEEDIMAEPGDEHPEKWFWEMLDNLGLTRIASLRPMAENEYEKVIEVWLKRKYMDNGQGGLFPLKNPSKDQRLVSIWDQMNFYLNEKLKGEEVL